jgi:hypothetical protein
MQLNISKLEQVEIRRLAIIFNKGLMKNHFLKHERQEGEKTSEE